MQADNMTSQALEAHNKHENIDKGEKVRYQLVVTHVNPSLSALYLHLSTHISITNKATETLGQAKSCRL